MTLEGHLLLGRDHLVQSGLRLLLMRLKSALYRR
ncbi:Uncharacterised protein [Vibrio cholerae]|nr:Uncharacterised protein [Vibrio cholerae]CSI54765.1 Uncharacterised protein [Vibrio cholerae]